MPNKPDQAADLIQIRDRIVASFGIYFPDNRLTELARKLKPVVKSACFETLSALEEALRANALNSEQRHMLTNSLTVGETYFFREIEAIEALGHTIIPSLSHQGKQRLRVWCAGCATGEESYSIAMYLLSTMPDIKKRNVTILATDINAAFLNKAREALYTPWSFRSIPKRYRSLYFRDIDGKNSALLPSVQSMVTFCHLNLAEESYPAHTNGTQDIDVIFCRNVLMYFEPVVMQTIIRRFAKALVPDGWLVVSQTECCDYFKADFDAVQCGGITLYRRKQTDNNAPCAIGTPIRPFRTKSPIKDHAGIPAAGLLPPINRPDFSRKLPDRDQPTFNRSGELLLQAREFADAGRLDDACVRCEELIVTDSLNVNAYMLHAAILQEACRFDEARAALRKVLYLKPDFVMGYYSLGVVEQKLGNRAEALRCFDTAARMLTAYQDGDILSEMEGLTVGRLKEFLAMAKK